MLHGAVFYTVLLSVACSARIWDRNFWYKNNDDELNKALRKLNTNVAKNLVLAIGDGLDITTTTATRIYRGQQTEGMLGEEALLSWDKFPHTGLAKTYSTDMTTVDSAASGTAYHCGVKTKYEMLGVDDSVQRKNCSTVAAATVKSVLDFALEEGKSVGIVTTDALVGASPASVYAHSAFRNWRADYELPDDAKGVCKDIARQLIEDNIDIQVLLGGGRKYFTPNTTSDNEYPQTNGVRTDGKNLIQQWSKAQSVKQRKAAYVWNRQLFDEVSARNTDYLLGMFEPNRMQEETIRKVNNTEPSIAEMTKKAIEILIKNPKGFYLFIEGANIDIGHHSNRAKLALEEGLAFDDAVGEVMKMTSSDDTLVVVSADHSHAFSFGGYSRRGQDILSVVDNPYDTNTDMSGNRYTALSYGNGPGQLDTDERVNLTLDTTYYDEDRVYLSNVKLKYDSHGGADVGIFASGPMSHVFSGVHEQTFVAHGMAYAACIGRNKEHCSQAASLAAKCAPCYSLAALILIMLTKLI